MIIIIDYGMGNLRSILNKLERLRIEAKISSTIADIKAADKLILPGVGAFGNGMMNIEKYNLHAVLNKRVLQDRIPILGICLGMQLFCRKSEEGNVEGLGWIEADVKKFNFNSLDEKLRIPHMGWNQTTIRNESLLVDGLGETAKFYYVHSYHVSADVRGVTVATACYGYDFPAIIQVDNIFGTQFHPEKSHRDGQQILKNFAEKI